MLCPYCAAREADTDDEVFSQFLGGRASVRACRLCNNTFGHTFEAAASHHLKQLMFFFRRSGMPPAPAQPKNSLWKNVPLGVDGTEYDIDANLKATLSRPLIQRDAEGKIVGARANRPQAKQLAKLAGEGKPAEVVEEIHTLSLEKLRVTYPLDDDTKRLCVKMSVALARRQKLDDVLWFPTRSYLLYATELDPCPVRVALDSYSELDAMRTPCAHLVYVRADAAQRRVYSVVQIFGFIQFYCELSHDYAGADATALAVHDPITHQEQIEPGPQLDYPLPARFIEGTLFGRMRPRLEQLRLELVSLYGDQAPETFTDAGNA